MQPPSGVEEEESQLGEGAAEGRQEGAVRKEKPAQAAAYQPNHRHQSRSPCDMPPPVALPKLILQELTPNTCPASHPRVPRFMPLGTAEMGTSTSKPEAQQQHGCPCRGQEQMIPAGDRDQ